MSTSPRSPRPRRAAPAAPSRAVPLATAFALALLPGAVLTAAPAAAGAQVAAVQATGRVTGTVVSQAGQPIADAQVSLVGTRLGAVTNQRGEFTISGVAPGNYTARVQRIGFGPQTRPITVAVGQPATVSFTVATVAVALDEVVTVGYTSETRREVSGAVASVAAEQLEERKVARVEEALSGRLAGVQVQSSGEPGQPSSIVVRGQNFLNNAQPLYVVDGLYLSQNPNLNPNDIASIQVLKDASAASQYGAQAANGVVIITTKRGQAGAQNRVSVQSFYGVQENTRRLDMMNATEWANITKQAYDNARAQDPQTAALPQGVTDILEGRLTTNNDWQDAILQRGNIQDHALQVSGGTNNASYFVGGGYTNQTGTLIRTGFERYSLRVNAEARRGRFTFGENLSLARSNKANLVLGEDAPLIEATRFNPAIPIRDANNAAIGGYGIGSAYLPTFGTNPVGLLETADATLQTNQVFGTTYGELALPFNLRYRLNLGFSYNDNNDRFFRERVTLRQNNPLDPASLNNQRDNSTSLLLENLLTYDQRVGASSFNIVGGFTQQRLQFDRLSAYRRNFVDPNLREIDAGDASQALNNSGFRVDTRLRSYLVRGTYSLADRYLATASFRRDGSSRFGPNNRWGNFGAGSLGWIASEEGFFKNSALGDAVSFLKFRASYGTLGNQDFADYQFAGLVEQNRSYLFGSSQVTPGSIQLSLANPNIKWQQNTEQNYGFDLNLFGDRLAFTADYYRRKSEDLLVRAPLPFSLGSAESPFINAGSVQSTGFELGATHRASRGRFQLNTSLNLTTIDQKVLTLGNGAQPLFRGGVARTAVGGPIGAFYVFKANGLFQNEAEVAAHGVQAGARPGDVRYVDVDGNGVLNDDDRYVAGSAIPDLEGGLFFDGRYRALDFNVGLRGSAGNEIFNQMAWWTGRMDDNANFRSGLRPWTPETAATANAPRALFGGLAAQNALRNSDRWIEDGSYLRVQNIQVGYNIPARFTQQLRIGNVQSARVYVNVQNAFLFTRYSGFDPEFVGYSAGSEYVLERGVDFGRVYPNPRTFTFGVNLGL